MSNPNDERRAAVEELLARERERLGDPPTPEEVGAYERGELPEAEAERIRDLLVVYPEWAPSAESVVSDEEMASDWVSVRRRIENLFNPMRIAAVVTIVVLGGLLVRSQTKIKQLTAERDLPRIHSVRHDLLPVGIERGPGDAAAYSLPRDEPNYLLRLQLPESRPGTRYRLEIVDQQVNPPRIAWSGSIASQEEETIELSVPRTFFKPGATYRLELYRANESSVAATYLVRPD